MIPSGIRSKDKDHKLTELWPGAWIVKNSYKGEYVFDAEPPIGLRCENSYHIVNWGNHEPPCPECGDYLRGKKRNNMKKIVLTGAPYSGKTTVINALRECGYAVIPEAAIMVIDAIHGLIPDGAVEWRDAYLEAFQYLIAQKQYELETIPQNGEVLFLDRGAFDGYAFAMHFKKEYPDICKELASKSTYDEVFLLDLVTPFDPRSDTGRIETEEDCHNLQVLLELAYRRQGYNPINVPLMDVQDRVDFILKKAKVPPPLRFNNQLF